MLEYAINIFLVFIYRLEFPALSVDFTVTVYFHTTVQLQRYPYNFYS